GAPAPPTGKEAFVAATRRLTDSDHETVLWEGTFSKLAMLGLWAAAAGLTIAVVIGGIAWGLDRGGWVLALLALGAIWIGLLLRLIYLQLSVHYKLTNQRIIHEHGLLWRKQDRIETIDVDDASVQQGPVQRLLGVGAIHVTSSDRTTPSFVLGGIENARQVATQIDDARRKERRRRGLHIESV
ncbi:MAG TPA: PH domain-containing protein, partial [Lacipirellulaceae bacterium]|nr:PH domain-containing protein [Lacipirellulaceae bacterium]